MMKYHMVYISALLAGVSACSNTDITTESSVPTYETLNISLEREACFGACPAYVVEISQDGTVDFCGINFVEHPGAQSRKVDPEKVQDLYKKIMAVDFFDLRDSYRGIVTDMPTHTITVTIDGRQKTVSDYAGLMDDMPQSVKDLQAAIDDTAGVKSWIGVSRFEPITAQYDCHVQWQKKKYAKS